MNPLTKFLFSIGAIGGSTGLSWLTYSQLFSANEQISPNQFRRIAQNLKNKSELLGKTGIRGFPDDLNEAGKRVQEWCEAQKKTQANPSQFSLYICEEKEITVKEAISDEESGKFIEDEEDYGYSLFMIKHELQLSEQNTELLKEATDKKKLKDWCEAELKKTFSEEVVNSLWLVEQLCKSSGITTVQDKAQLEHLRREKGAWEKTNNFENTLASWKSESSFTELLKQQTPSISEADLNKEKLAEWCDTSLKMKMTESITPTFITHVEFVCSGKTPTEMKESENNSRE